MGYSKSYTKSGLTTPSIFFLFWRSVLERLEWFVIKGVTEPDASITDALVYALIERGYLTEYEKDYLDVLKILVWDYEQTQEHIPVVSGV